MTRLPMWDRVLPGGWRVFVCGTSSGNPPGYNGGMATCSCELWCRLVRGEWDSGWHRCNDRSGVKVRRWWEAVELAADVPDAWDITVGGVWPPPRYDEIYFKGLEWLETL